MWFSAKQNCSSEQPSGSVVSEMFKLLIIFFWIESTSETSLLSRYSTSSGLLIESHEDVVSSIETNLPSDLLGETSMPLRTGTANVATVGAASFFCDKELAFGITTELELTDFNWEDLFPEIVDFETLVLAGASFLVLATLFEPCTLHYIIQLIYNQR